MAVVVFSDIWGHTTICFVCAFAQFGRGVKERESKRQKESAGGGALIAGIAFNWLSLKLKAAAN